MKTNALRKPIVTLAEIESIVAMREIAKATKKRLETLQDIIKIHEDEIISKLDQGADVLSHEYLVSVSETSKRFVSWKEVFIDVCGKEAADKALDITVPTTYRNLVIKAA